MPGTLTFRPIEANLTVKDKDLIGKMDPYFLFHVGGQKIKSQVCQSGGQHPIWNDSVSVPLPSTGGFVQVDLKDKDMLIDDRIGTFELDLNEITSLGQVRKWYPIFSKDRPAGEILIETIFSGQSQQGFGQQQGLGQQQQFIGGGVPTTQSTMTRNIPQGGQQVLGNQQMNQGYPSQYQGNYPSQNMQQSGGQPLQFTGVQANVIPVGGVGSSVEQYATEALMRGVDPMNTQQHYHYNVVNGSTNPGFSGIPMNYSAGNSGNLLNQNPSSLTQTPLYSGSQPLNYEGNQGHAATLTNTFTTGHHNEGFMGKLQQKEAQMDQNWGNHTTKQVESKNLNTGDFRKY